MSRFGPVHEEEDEILDGEYGETFVVRREEDEGEDPPSESPRTALLSGIEQSRDSVSLAERNSLRRPSRRERDRRRSSTYRELLKLLVSEDMEVKQSRRTLETALERLQGETQRAQLAEQRALDLAARFKQVNDARIIAQRDADRLAQELRLYRDQLDVAQKELLKGEDLMKDLEAQRDDAEAVAARARSTARRLREQQLVTRAREDGRRMGYQEGLQRGYEEVGMTPPPRLDARLPSGSRMEGDMDDDGDETGRVTPSRQYTSGVLNLPSPPTGAIPPNPRSDVDTLDDPGPSRRRHAGDYPDAGVQGSRFMENMTPATMSSAPLPDQRQSGPQSWPPPPNMDEEGFTRPIPIRTASPAPHHPSYTVLPDNYVPSVGSDNNILLPPPHELSRPPPTTRQADDTMRAPPTLSQGVSQDYAHRRPASPRSMTESLPSTTMTMSDFDLLNAPRTRPSGGRDRGPVLSAIPEAEFSPPASDARARGGTMPEPITFPAPSSRPGSGYLGSDAGRRPGSRSSRRDDVSAAGSSRRRNPPIQDEPPENVRHSNASVADWLEKQASPESHPRASPTPAQHTRYQPYVTDVTEEERLPSPYERPPSSATGSATRHHRSRSGSLNRPSIPSPLPLEGHRRGHSSDESIVISIQLPSGSESLVSPGQPLESSKLAPSGSVRRSRTPQQQFVLPAPAHPTMRNAPPIGNVQSMSQLPSNFVPMAAPPMIYNQPMPAPVYSPRSSQHRLYQQPEPDEGPVVPMMLSHSSSSLGSKARPPRNVPAPALTRASSRASGSMNYELPGSRPPSVNPPTQPSGNRPITPTQTNYGPAPSRPYTPTQPKYIPAPSSPRMIPAPAPASQIYPDGSRWSPRPNDVALPIPAPSEARYIPAPSSPRMVPAPAPSMAIYQDGSRWSPNPGSMQLPGAGATFSPRSSTSRLSLAGGNGHQRSLSLNAGLTPAATSRPLSSKGAASGLRRVPSASSVGSGHSRQSGYTHFDPSSYKDVAYLASSEDLRAAAAAQSPGTWANTRQNVVVPMAPGDPHLRSSSALSYVSSNRVG